MHISAADIGSDDRRRDRNLACTSSDVKYYNNKSEHFINQYDVRKYKKIHFLNKQLVYYQTNLKGTA
jgi:hypothetical protein